MSLARKHRDKIMAKQSAAAASSSLDGGPAPAAGLPASPAGGAANPAAAQIKLRLTHDLRRLKEIQSIARKIEVKAEMLPEYVPWIRGLLEAEKESGAVDKGEILPTIMIWLIDTGQFDDAMPLIRYVLRHQVPLPARYERQAATLITEEIAEAALKALNADEAFPLDVLEELEILVTDEDMPDEVRAKHFKAVGLLYARQADAAAEGGETPERLGFLRACALQALNAAQRLNDRIGVKTVIKKIERDAAKAADAQKDAEEGA